MLSLGSEELDISMDNFRHRVIITPPSRAHRDSFRKDTLDRNIWDLSV
jgi:hypothetical protein